VGKDNNRRRLVISKDNDKDLSNPPSCTCYFEAQHELEDVMGADEFIEQLEHRRSQIDAIERGLLEREMILVQAN
jgi:hypothetical protein